MLSPSQFWLYGWRVCLYFAIGFADGFVVDDPIFFEGVFAANILRFEIHFWLFLFRKNLGLRELSRVNFTKFGVL